MVQRERLINLQVDTASQRLDRFLADAVPNLSRSQAQRLIREGRVTLAGVPAKPSATVTPGTRVVVRMPPSPSDEPTPQSIPLEVVYEDDLEGEEELLFDFSEGEIRALPQEVAESELGARETGIS